jgi:hypothetical protein
MTGWILEETVDYEGGRLIGFFATLEESQRIALEEAVPNEGESLDWKNSPMHEWWRAPRGATSLFEARIEDRTYRIWGVAV